MSVIPQGQIQSGAKPDSGVQDILFGRKAADLNTPDENDRVKEVTAMFQKAKMWKAQWGKNFKRWDNLWESNHYKDRVNTTITQAVVNQIWGSIETFLGHVIDALPDPLARARRPEHKQKAQLITKWLKYESDTNDLEQEIQHPVRQACKRGVGWFKVSWNEDKNGGRGEVDILPVDDDFMYPAPYARNVKELLYLIEAKNVPREFVVRNWEKGADLPIGAMDGSLSNIMTYEGDRNSATSNYALVSTTTGSDTRWTGSAGIAGGKKSDLVTLIECWTREQDGTMRLTVIANGVILQDGPSPYADDDFPYAVVNIIPTMDTIHGRGLCQFIEGLQEILNESLSLLIDQQRFASDPMMIVDSPNEEEGSIIENQPGGVLFNANPTSEGYRWLTAPGFNQAWVEIQKGISEYMDSILGRVDVLKGERPAGVDTLGAMEIIRDEANVRVRNLIRWVKASLKRVYLLTLSRLRQYAKGERTIRIIGKSGQEDFQTVNPVMGVGVDGMPAQDMTIPDDAEFDVEFAKEAPGGRQAKKEEALLLAQTPAQDGLPMVTRKYVLDTYEIEEAPEIMQEIDAELASQQEAQMAASGMAPATPTDPVDNLIRQMMMGGGMSGAQPSATSPPETGSAIASGAPVAPHPQPENPSGEVVDLERDASGKVIRFKKQYTYGGAA